MGFLEKMVDLKGGFIGSGGSAATNGNLELLVAKAMAHAWVRIWSVVRLAQGHFFEC